MKEDPKKRMAEVKITQNMILNIFIRNQIRYEYKFDA